MNVKPTVSVIIPTYLRTEFLKIALESVKNQTEKPNEVIIVDDNIDNDISKKVEEICALFKNHLIIHIVRSNGAGGAEARNIGAREASSELLAFLDDDDYWLPNKLKLQKKHIIECAKKCDAVFCMMELVYMDAKNISRIVGSIPHDYKELFFQNSMPNPSCFLVKKDVFKLLGGFDKRLKAHQDQDMWLRLLMEHRVCLLPNVLCKVNSSINNRNSITHSKAKIVGERQFIYKWKNHPEISNEIYRNRFWALHYSKLADIYRSQNNKKRAINAMKRSIGYQFSIKKIFRLLYWKIGIRKGIYGKFRLYLLKMKKFKAN